MRPCGSSAPSRRAATGGTRVARRAGAREASSVTIVPTAIGTITVRGWMVTPASGRPNPTASNSAPSSFAKPTPAAMPMPDAMSPTASASPSTLRRICRRMAPMVRSIANSLMRWATVIEKVLKMTNAPTSTAAPANARRAGVKNELMPPAIWSVCSLAASAPVCTFTEPGTVAMMRCLSSRGETPGSACTEIVEVFPTRSYHSCASAKVVDTTVVPPIEDTPPPKSKMPEIVTRWTPSSVVSPTCWPTWRFSSLASFSGIATSPLAAGKWPLTIVFWLNGLGWVENTSAGAPPWALTNFPFTTSEPAAWIWPLTCATPGTCLTWSISAASSGPTWAVSPPAPLPNAGRLLMNTSVPEKAFPKMSEKAFSIWSVMTNVPAIIAVPRTIANAVSVERSLWLRSPRSVKRVMSSRSGPSWRGSRRRPCPTRRAR